MNWGQGQWLTKCGMRAVIAQVKSEKIKWIYRGVICCPTTGALVMAIWDHSGRCLNIAGTEVDQDFDLLHEHYSKES